MRPDIYRRRKLKTINTEKNKKKIKRPNSRSSKNYAQNIESYVDRSQKRVRERPSFLFIFYIVITKINAKNQLSVILRAPLPTNIKGSRKADSNLEAIKRKPK